jgi:hypothetical protein
VASGAQVSGIEMADGRTIRLVVQILIAAKPKRPPLKRIAALQPFFFPLTTLFCPDCESVDSSLKISTAAASLNRVRKAQDAPAIDFLDQYVDLPRRNLADLRLAHEKNRSKSLSLDRNLPKFLQQALERRGSLASERVIYSSVKQPRVILFSES